MIAIIDYDAGNIKSVEKALLYLGEKAEITRDKEKILNADKVILPGVGNFGDAMANIHKYELAPVIESVIEKKTPFLGICVGLQLLFERSEESVGVPGLGILEGEIVRIPEAEGLKVPQIGWNDIEIDRSCPIFAGLPERPYVYFVHSYYLKAKEESIVKATTEYGTLIHAAVQKDNVYACQFHPEKSSEIGLKILKNFIEL